MVLTLRVPQKHADSQRSWIRKNSAGFGDPLNSCDFSYLPKSVPLGVSMVPPQPRQSGNQRQMNTSQPASCKLITVGLFRPAGLTFKLISYVSIATGFSVIGSLVSQLDLQRSRSDRPHYSLPKITRLNVKRSDYRLQILNASNPFLATFFLVSNSFTKISANKSDNQGMVTHTSDSLRPYLAWDDFWENLRNYMFTDP